MVSHDLYFVLQTKCDLDVSDNDRGPCKTWLDLILFMPNHSFTFCENSLHNFLIFFLSFNKIWKANYPRHQDENRLLTYPRKHSRMLNWASKEYQLDGAVGSGYITWVLPVASSDKAAGRFMLFWHFWNMQCQIFYSNCSFFYYILQEMLWGYPQVKNMLNVEFSKSMEDFHPCW